MIRRLFEKIRAKFKREETSQATESPKQNGRTTHRMTPEEQVRKILPVVFQRKHTDILPVFPEGVRAVSMDEAVESCGFRPLPDIYSVQNIIPGVVLSWFGAHSFIGHQACAILAQHWLIDKACSQAPRDAVQNGFQPVVSLASGEEVPTDVIKKIQTINKDRGVLAECREFARNARIFGIRHALFIVDGIDYELPFNLDGVKPGSYKGISQIDPYWMVPEFASSSISDPGAMHFYEPTWWRLPGGQRVHRSHFVIIRESEVPDILKPTYYYGGLPMPQLIFERVYAAERTADEAPELALTKRLITMQGSLENYLADENETTERLHAFNQLRSNFGFLVIGEDEQINQIDTSLADFDGLLMSQYQLVAAIARTPATKLLGTSPKGFNATGEHESDSYDQELGSIQENNMTPLLDRHHELLCRSEFSDLPGLDILIEWEPVRKAKASEKADNNLKKAQTDQALIASGIVSPDEAHERLMNDPESGYAGIVSEESEEDLVDLEEDLNGEENSYT